MIIAVNWVLRKSSVYMIKYWIGYPTKTEEMIQITKMTFYVVFLNTGWLLMLSNANMSEQPISFGLTQGVYSDFNSDWFSSVGVIVVQTMIFNMFYPLLEFLLYFAWR